MFRFPKLKFAIVAACACVMSCITGRAHCQTLYSLDMRQASPNRWHDPHDISKMEYTPDGLVIHISDTDPYVFGPTIDFPADKKLWLDITLQSETGGIGQIYYFSKNASEPDSVRFPVKPKMKQVIRVPIPALGSNWHIRFDPPGVSGKCTLQKMVFSIRKSITAPSFPPPADFVPLPQASILKSKDMVMKHNPRFGDFGIYFKGSLVATGHNRLMIGYQVNNKLEWKNLCELPTIIRKTQNNGLIVTTSWKDSQSATWNLVQSFTNSRALAGFDCNTVLNCSESRGLIYCPALILLPGHNSYGSKHKQAVFSGLEYLDTQDTSSSEADIIGSGSHRLVPDMIRVTTPLMALANDNHVISLCWHPAPNVSPIFDVPDRIFHSNSNVLGTVFPGSNGMNRDESSLIPYEHQEINAGQSLFLNSTITVTTGSDITPAVKDYVLNHPLPSIPVKLSASEFNQYISLTSAAYLSPGLTHDGTIRHAFPGKFGFNPAADVAVWLMWLSQVSSNSETRSALTAASKQFLKKPDPASWFKSSVGHITYPVAPLLFGHLKENIRSAAQYASNQLNRLNSEGALPYKWNGNGLDFGKTHFSSEANGLTAQVVAEALDAALFSGDKSVQARAIKALHGLDKYNGTVPRGAQTWEVPLHTPDILASGHLVKAYTLGFELTGDKELLKHAEYWAWTGIPFVTLWNPTGQNIGPYATTAVFGATEWIAPNWMGMPVQWCGLVYAESLYRLSKHTNKVLWSKVADGITASGIQQIWRPEENLDRQGLLPDSVLLKPQLKNDAAINPGTLLPLAARFFGQPLFDYSKLTVGGTVFAAGRISNTAIKPNELMIEPWHKGPSYVLFTGAPVDLMNKMEVVPEPLERMSGSAQQGWIAFKVQGKSRITVGK